MGRRPFSFAHNECSINQELRRLRIRSPGMVNFRPVGAVKYKREPLRQVPGRVAPLGPVRPETTNNTSPAGPGE